MRNTLVLAFFSGIVVLGCSKSEPPPPIAVASAAPIAASVAAPAPASPPDPAAPAVDPSPALNNAPTPAAAATAAVAAKAVPTEADYEVNAETAITPANAAQVLAAIDAQVGK